MNRSLTALGSCSLALVLGVVKPLWAFDDDRGISDVLLKDESFLDINANDFRKSLYLEWREQLNGWRIAVGSTSTDRAFIFNDLRLHTDLSQAFSLSLDWREEAFYAPRQTPAPLASANVYPVEGGDIGFAILGTPAHDKRQSDFGYAILFGRRPHDYLKLSYLEVDKFYNDKNSFDESFYRKPAKKLAVEGSYGLGEQWLIDFELEREEPLDFVFDDPSSSFRHEGHDYRIKLIYQPDAEITYGVNLRDHSVDKTLQQTTSDETQRIDYQSIDIYRIAPLDAEYELTLGLRHDSFREDFDDVLNPAARYRFELETQQLYATLFHQYKAHQAWDLGLYIGYSERKKRFAVANPDDADESGVQAKLRTSWQYHSLDRSAVFLVSVSLNLDDLVDDPGDGGGIYFQKLF